MQVRRKLANFFNWRVTVTLTDGRVLVGTLMAVDKHVNVVLCNTEEYRKYKVKGKPEGKELKRMLGFVVLRGTGILYVQPEEAGKEDLVETDKPKKAKAAPKAAPATAKAGAAAPGAPVMQLPNMMGMPGLRMPALPGGAAFPGMAGLPGGVRPGGMPSLPGMPVGMPQINPAMLAAAKAAMPGFQMPNFGALPGGLPGGMSMPMPGSS